MGRPWRPGAHRRAHLSVLLVVAVSAVAITLWLETRSREDGAAASARRGAELFGTEFTPEQGLGPVFNGRACSTCHATPGPGGVGPDGLATVLRAGRLTDAGFDPTFGERRIEAHAHAVSELGVDCDREAGIPAGANVTSVRNTPPLFGAGLIDAIPDEVIRAGAVDKGNGVSGRPNLVPGPDGREDVGRFGWKADGPTLELFVAEAFRSELGLTSPLAPPAPLGASGSRYPGEGSDPELDRDVLQSVTAFVAGLPAPRSSISAGPGAGVFTSEEGRTLERSNFRQRVWLPATKAAGLEGLRFHDLRHTAGTLAARTGATTKELMARLGHASPQASMMYQHAADDRDRRIAEGLDAMAEEAGLRPPETGEHHQSLARSGTDLARQPRHEPPQ